MSDYDVESYQAGYRAGFDAGKASAVDALLPVTVRRKRLPLPADRRCDCGHADRSHNDLGYCQCKGRDGYDSCGCEGFTNEHHRRIVAEYRASENKSGDQS